MDAIEFMKLAIIDEKGAVAKYRQAAKAAKAAKDPQLKALFERFVDEEQVHIDILEGEIEKLKKAGKK